MPESASNLRKGRFVETSVAGEIVRAFVPPPLPPEPQIDVLTLLERLSLAERALGRLDGMTMLLPRQELFHCKRPVRTTADAVDVRLRT